MMKTMINFRIYRLFRPLMICVFLIGIHTALWPQNHALTFDGSGDYVDFGNPSGLQISGSQTIEMWIHPYSLSARRNPIAKAYAGEGTITMETNGTLNYYYGTGGGNNTPYQGFNSESTLPVNEWTHIALVRDLDAMKLYWYFNGIRVAEAPAQFSYAQTGSNPFFVARGYVSDFHGMMDEVRIWNIARTASEIVAYRNTMLSGAEFGLAAYWPFNEGSGTLVYDGSPNGIDGNLFGNTAFVISEAPVFPVAPGNEPFESVPPTGLPYNIVLSDLQINGSEIPLGTQIAVFDGELCVGTVYYDGSPNQNLVAWEADPGQNLAGFTPGNDMSFKFHTVWYSELRNFDATETMIRGDGTFGFSPFSVVQLSASTSLEPEIVVPDELINFNTVIINQSSTLPLPIENNGTAMLSIYSVQTSSQFFTASAGGLLILPGQKDTLWITFSPATVTTYAAQLSFSGDDPDEPVFEIPLFGTGLPQPTPQIVVTPSAVNFGGIAVNTTKTMNLNILNPGNGNLSITSINSSNPAFSVLGNTSFTLGQGENINVPVVFAPVQPGSFNGQITIQNNVQTVVVPVAGTASQGHFASVAPTGKPYSILVEDVEMPGFSPKPGDEFAVLDDTLCVGIGMTGIGGSSLQLIGSNGYVINDNSTAFDLQQLTISAWVYSSNFNQNGFIFEKGPVNSQYSMFFEGNVIKFRTYPTSGGYEDFSVSLSNAGIVNNQWNHVAMTYDGTQKRLYVNGQLRGSQNYSKTLRTGQQGQIIGAYGGTGSHAYYFNGLIDEVRVWNYARPAFSIQDQMFRELKGNEPGLVGYWNFNNGNFNSLVQGATPSYMVGNATLEGVQNPEIFSDILITAWEKDDDLGLPGFTPGNPISFKVWTEVFSNWVEVDMTPDFVVGDGTFGFGQMSVVNLSGNTGLQPVLHVPIESLYVGQITVGQTAQNDVQVFNNGNAPLEISVEIQSSAFSSAISTAEIPANDSLTFQVTFAPTTAGGYSADLLITGNDPENTTHNIALEGFALPSGEPGIATSVNQLNFENVPVNTADTMELVVINTGTTPLAVTNIASDNAAFTISPTSFTLQNTNDLQEVLVTFQPDQKGAESATMLITSNATQKSVALSGIGFEDYFQVVDPTGLPYVIIVEATNLPAGTIVPGDELAVFDGETCVGIAAIPEAGNFVITAWQADPANGLPGFTPGNPMSFGLWTDINGFPTQLPAQATFSTGNGNFGFGQFSVAYLTFDLPEISAVPDEIFVALDEPDSTQQQMTIFNNGSAALQFAFDNFSDGRFHVAYHYSPGTGVSPDIGPLIYEAKDDFINENWGGAGPGNGVGNDDFQVIWRGYIHAPVAGTYQFRSYTDDGLRLYINEQEVINYWLDQGATSRTGSITLPAGLHQLEFQYYENGSVATASLYWTPPGQPEELVPAAGIDWLMVEPMSGTIQPGAEQQVTLSFNTTGLNDGLYSFAIPLHSNDPLNDVPEIQVAMNVTGNPQITSSPVSTNFGNVVVGASAAESFEIRNIGTKDLEITDIFPGGGAMSDFSTGFDMGQLPLTLTPGGSAAVDVLFSPQAPGTALDTLFVVSNAGNWPLFGHPLSGQGITPPEIFLPETSFSYTSACNVNFGDTLTIINNGQDSLQISISSDVFWLDAAFPQAIIAGGDSLALLVQISTIDLFAGTHNGMMTINSNDPLQPSLDVDFSIVVTGDPAILCNDFLNLGTVNAGESFTGELTVANSGCDLLQITSVSIQSTFPVFSVINPAFEVLPGEAGLLEIVFAPEASQQYSGIITINSNDPDVPALAVVVSGIGVEPPKIAVTPLAITTEIQSGNTEQQSFQVKNTGGLVLDFESELNPINQFMLHLDGNGDYINVNHNNLLNPTDEITMEAWVYLFDNVNEFIIGKENSSEGNYRLFVNGNSRFEFKLNGQFSVVSNAQAAKNQWYHVAAAFDGSTMRIFINGIEDASQTFAPFTIQPNTDNLRIGRSYQFNYFNGLINEVRLWNIARNESEIQSAMHQPLLGTEEELLLWFPFVNAIGNIVTDASPNGFSGIMFGNPQRQASTVPFDDYLQMTNDSGSLTANQQQDVLLDINTAGFFARDYQRSIAVTSNAITNPDQEVTFDLTISGEAVISADPAQVAFDATFVGLKDTFELAIENTGATAEMISEISFSSPVFYSLNEVYKVFPFSSKKLMLVFEPDQPGNFSETLTISLGGAKSGQLEIPLTATGLTPPVPVLTPEFFDFGPVVVNNPESAGISLSNAGSSALEVYGFAFSDNTFFSSDFAPPQTIDFGEEINFEITFNPTNYNPVAVDMIFQTNIGAVVLPLSGTGVPPDHDLAVTAILAPQDDCGLSDSETLMVEIHNFGVLPQTDFEVGFSLNDAPMVTETVVGTLASGQSLEFAFSQTLNLSAVGTYQIDVSTLLPIDQNVVNDTLVSTVENIPAVGPVSGLIPADSAFGVTEPVVFSWAAASGATAYDLYLWRTTQQKPAVPTVQGIAATSYTYLDYLNKNYLYNWQIVARNECSQSESVVHLFSFNVFSDLTVAEVIAPENANAGDNIDISFTIENIGTGATGIIPWKDEVYLSLTPVFDQATAVKVATVNNQAALNFGQSYTQTVSVKLGDYLEGDFYVFVRTDVNNIIQETDEGNNTLGTTGTMAVSLPPYPDITVSDIQSLSGNIIPGQMVSIGWNVVNIGDAPAAGGWSQRVAIVQGSQIQVLGFMQNNEMLDPGMSLAQSSSFMVPNQLGLEGDVLIQVRLTPNPLLVEKPNGGANNTVLSDETAFMEKRLTLSIPQTTLNENAPFPLNCMIFRSGSRGQALEVNFAVSVPGKITIPQTVTIPANQASVPFTIAAINNSEIGGNTELEIYATAAGYPEATSLLTIIDDEVPALALQLSAGEAAEGDVFELTVSRDLITGQALTVTLFTLKSGQISLPAQVVIPANEAAVSIEVEVVDNSQPELTEEVVINATVAGYLPSSASIIILDDDVPGVTLTIAPATVSEGGGPYASFGTIELSEPAIGNMLVMITASPAGQVYFPAQVTIPNGQVQGQFNIGAVDNGILDGDRDVEITAALFVSTCGCTAPPETGATDTQTLTILDNDGPSLSVAANPFIVPENVVDAGLLTITRNTLGGPEVAINLQHNQPDEIQIQQTAIIPEGATSVQVPFSTLDDGIEDGDQIVTITVTAGDYSSGSCWVIVSDRNLPDYVAKSLALSHNSILINETVNMTFTIANEGFALAADDVEVEFFRSEDAALSADDLLLSTQYTASTMNIGGSLQMNFSYTPTDKVGDFYILATVNANGGKAELSAINNTSVAMPLNISPDYTATAQVDGDVFNGTAPIVITGTTQTVVKAPAPYKSVDVYVVVNGSRRVFNAVSNGSGEFSVTFVPVNGEAGEYYVGACYPGEGLDEAQDEFTILGARHTASGYIIWDIWLNETREYFLEIKNYSPVELNDLQLEVLSAPAGCNVSFTPIGQLPGNGMATMSYTIQATEVTSGTLYEEVKLQLTSAEGTKFRFSAWFYSRATMGNLKLNPVSLNKAMVKGITNYAEFEILNNGLDSTGTITVSIPQNTWMSLASPGAIQSLAPGQTAVVTLKLIPGEDLQLNNPVTGQIAISGANSNSVALPFSFEPVSLETGNFLVDVVDEYTYNTPEAPHLEGATVVFAHPYTGEIIAQGITNSDGHFLAEDLNEGFYNLRVSAPQHASYQNIVFVEKGITTTEVVFIAFQAITYSWEVIPTMIEDEYEITLTVVFETNVPAPVVIMEMPDTIPQLNYGEVFPFILTMTNHGLITAQDVELTFPEDEEYEFIANVNTLDILPQSAVQIPVYVQRRTDAATSGKSANCSDFTIASYKFECGPDDQMRIVQDEVYYEGRICGSLAVGGWCFSCGWGDGGPGGPGGAGGYGPYFPIEIPTVPYTSKNLGCDPCLADFLNALWDCSPIPNIGIGKGYEIKGGTGKLAQLGRVLKPAKKILDKAKCAFNIGWSLGCKINQSLGDAPAPLNAPEEIIQAQEDLFMVDKAFAATENIALEVYNDEMLLSRADFVILNDSVIDNIENEEPITQTRLNELLMAFAESDVTAMEIEAFVNRFNTTLEAYDLGIFSPTPEYPNIIDTIPLNYFSLSYDTAFNYALQRGYASVEELYNAAYAIVEGYTEETSSAVCATVTVQFSQMLTMEREAFEGTLTIFNGHESDAMENIQLDLQVRDEEGFIRNDLFEITTKSLNQITGIDGSGTLDSQVEGTAVILFIPERGAAPDFPKFYSFGGTLSYLDPFTGEIFEQPLLPVTLQVNPAPDLYIDYFMQRDILGDDALTEPIEPMIPAELAVMIDNRGAGTAYSVNIESAQPEIIENEKGLLIDFNIVGSSLSGQPAQLGLLNVNFGDIPGGDIRVGQWWFTSTLLGHFISYDVEVNHLNSFGNPDLSLISSVEIHELIKSIRVYGPLDDSIHDFLVNDIPDTDDIPDAIYYSNGIVAQVHEADAASFDGTVSLNDLEVELTVTPSAVGWNYIKLDDPGNGFFRIVSCEREDGQEIPLKNVWLTHVTIPDGGEPVYENKFHFVDDFAGTDPVSYTIVFEAIDQNFPQVTAINGIPEGATDAPVTNVEVVFNKPIDPATYDYQDMTLKNQGGPNLMDETVIVTQVNDTTFDVDISAKTSANGFYVLTVQAAGIADLIGNYGQTGVQASWIQAISTPAIDFFLGLPEDGQPIDSLMVVFNMPINVSTFTNEQIELRDGQGNIIPSSSLVITSESFNNVLFKIKGLLALASDNETYELTFRVTEILGETGLAGLLDQTVSWDVCQVPPPLADAGEDASICIGASYPLEGSVDNAAAALWTTAGSGTFDDPALLNATYFPGEEDIVEGLVMLTLMAQPLDDCADADSSQMLLTIKKSVVADAGEDATTCQNTQHELFGVVENASSSAWITSGDGTFSSAGSLTPLYYPGTEDIANGSVLLSLIAQPVAPCLLSDTSEMVLTIQRLPVAFAGENQTICEDELIELNGTAEFFSGVAWVAGGDGTFDDRTQLSTVYTPGELDLERGFAVFLLIVESESPCFNRAFSVVRFDFANKPVALAGTNSTICENSVHYLAGIVEYHSSLLWETSGDGTFSDPAISNPVYTPGASDIESGSVELSLTAQPLSPCQNAVSSSKTLSIQKLPVSNAGEDGLICEDQVYQLDGTATNMSSVFWQTAGDGTFSSQQVLNPVYTPGAGDIVEGSVVLTLAANPFSPCFAADVATLTLFIQPLPTVDAGEDATICEGQSLSLNGSVSDANSFEWQTSGDGVFANQNDLQTIYTPGVGDIQNGTVSITLLAQPVEPCSTETLSELELSIQRLPLSHAGDDATICEGDTHTLSGAVEFAGNYYWQTGGDGSFDDPFSLEAVYTPGTADIESGTVVVTLIAEPMAPCALTDESSITIVITKLPVADAGDDGTICHNNTFEVSGSVSHAASFLWETSGDGYFDVNSALTALYTPGENDIQTGSVVISLTAEPVAPCVVAASDELILTINYCQDVVIPAGWSGLSAFVNPAEADVETLLSPILDELIILHSQSGFFWPGQNVNTIGQWSAMEGYTVKVSESVDFTFAGIRSSDRTLELSAGWNLIPVLSECAADVELLFSGVDAEIVKEVAGWQLYWPLFGINTLQALEPGKAYYVFMGSPGSITFPACTSKSSPEGGSAVNQKMTAIVESSPWGDFIPTPQPHTIALTDASGLELLVRNGDYIGAFDEQGNCFGVAVWEEAAAAILLFANDPTTAAKDGFDEGEAVSFRIFVGTTGNEYDLDVSWNAGLPQHDGKFSLNGISEISGAKLGETGVGELSSTEVHIYPNPANDVLNLDFATAQHLEAILLDLHGKEVLRQNVSGLRNRLDISMLKSGIYLLKLEGSETILIEKIIKH